MITDKLSIYLDHFERVAGIEPASSAWKAEVLPLYHTRINVILEGAGVEPAKAGPADLQTALGDRLSTPPKINLCILTKQVKISTSFLLFERVQLGLSSMVVLVF